jgi:hypothetical protein
MPTLHEPSVWRPGGGTSLLLTEVNCTRVAPIRMQREAKRRRGQGTAERSVAYWWNSSRKVGINREERSKPCLPFFFLACGSRFQVSLCHRCASNLPVHRCLVTPRYAEVRWEGRHSGGALFRARFGFAPAVLEPSLAAAFLRGLAIVASS